MTDAEKKALNEKIAVWYGFRKYIVNRYEQWFDKANHAVEINFTDSPEQMVMLIDELVKRKYNAYIFTCGDRNEYFVQIVKFGGSRVIAIGRAETMPLAVAMAVGKLIEKEQADGKRD